MSTFLHVLATIPVLVLWLGPAFLGLLLAIAAGVDTVREARRSRADRPFAAPRLVTGRHVARLQHE